MPLALLFLMIAAPWHHSSAAAAELAIEEPQKLIADQVRKITAESPASQALSQEANSQLIALCNHDNALLAHLVNTLQEQLQYPTLLQMIKEGTINLAPLDIAMYMIAPQPTDAAAQATSSFIATKDPLLPAWLIDHFSHHHLHTTKKNECPANQAWEDLCDAWYTFYIALIYAKKDQPNTLYPYLWFYQRLFSHTWYREEDAQKTLPLLLHARDFTKLVQYCVLEAVLRA